MKSLLYILTMCFGLILGAQAENFDLDDVTIELVEEGEEIAHQIHIPVVEEPDRGLDGVKAGRDQDVADKLDSSSDPHNEESGSTVKAVSASEDEFLDILDEAEDLEELLETEQQEAMVLADEMLQQAEEEVQEIEQEIDVSSDELEEERRDEEALIDEIKHYEDKDEGDSGEEEPDDVDKERDEEEVIEGVSSEGNLD